GHGDGGAPGVAPLPPDLGAGPPVQDVEQHGRDRGDVVQGQHQVAAPGVGRQLRQSFELDQGQAGDAGQDADGEESDAQADGDAVGAVPGRGQVDEPEEQKRQDEGDADEDVAHEDADGVGVGVRGRAPLQDADGGQVDAGGAEQGDGGEDDDQQDTEPRADGRL